MEQFQPRNLDQDIQQILSSKPAEAKSNDFINNLYKTLKPTKSPIKVALLSDFHVDPYYTEGANTDCSESICCRPSSGIPAISANQAGKWGDYRCDTPMRTVDSLFNYV